MRKLSNETILNGLREEYEEAIGNGQMNEVLGKFINDEAADNWTKCRIINELADKLARESLSRDNEANAESDALYRAGVI